MGSLLGQAGRQSAYQSSCIHAVKSYVFIPLIRLLQGVYVLQDNSFKPIIKISSWDGRADATRQAKMVCDHRTTCALDLIAPQVRGLPSWGDQRRIVKTGITRHCNT